MTRQPGCLPTIIPDNGAVGLVQMSDQNGNVSWQPITAPDVPAGSTSAAGILQLDGTAADLQTPGVAAAGSTGKAADAGHVHPASSGMWLPADSGWLAWNYEPALIQTQTAVTNNTVTLIRVNVRQSISVTNVILYMGSPVASNLTATQNVAGLYCGGAFGAFTAGQLIAATADQSSAWAANASSYHVMALSGGPYALAPGFYWVAVLVNQSSGAAPLWGRVGNDQVNQANPGLTAATARFATAGTATALGTITPASSTFTALETWAALS